MLGSDLIDDEFQAALSVGGVVVIETDYEVHQIPRREVRHVGVKHADSTDSVWILTYTLMNAAPREIMFYGDGYSEALRMMGRLSRGVHDVRIVVKRGG